MTSLATIRTRVRQRLDDVAATIWTDAELQEHIEAALRDLSIAVPREQKSSVATTNGSRDISLSLTDRVTVEAVEFPTGSFPREYQPFAVWADVLTLTGDVIGTGANCAIYWTSLHTINGSSTLPTKHDETLLLGAAWLACESQAADTTNAINDGGDAVPRDWSQLARFYRLAYEKRKNHARGIRVRSVRSPDQPYKRQQNTDPGP